MKHTCQSKNKTNSLLLIILLTTFMAFNAFAQVRIMPVGNSITWGKIRKTAPSSSQHGYRSYLYQELAGLGFSFTGPQTGTYAAYVGDGDISNGGEIDSPYLGYYVNGAKLTEFMADSTYDLLGMMNQMATTDLPDYILMHLGTNDIFTTRDVGDISTSGSMIHSLNTIITNLLNFNTSGHVIEKIYLCKIIPMSPVADFPVENARIIEYNAQIDEMVSTYSAANQNRIQIVNMYASFYANQTNYYETQYDNTHPSDAGYQAMGGIFANYLQKELNPSTTDEFDRTAFATGASGDGWYVNEPGPTFTIEDVNEGASSNAGALTISGNPSSTAWQTMAIWDETQGKNTVSIKFHEDSDEEYIGRVGILVGMTVNDFNTIGNADGYMVWISGGTTRVYDVQNGVAHTSVATSLNIPQYGPGDELKVRFVQTSSQNEFYITINDGETYKLRDTEKKQADIDDIAISELYSGVIFRDDAWNEPASPDEGVMLDNFVAENALEDETPPAQISDFQVFSTTGSTITLAWTATGNDGNDGTAATYEIRYATSQFTADDFNSASLVSNVPAPNEAGTPESFTITGLPAGVRFYFRIKAIDDWGNASDPSDLADGKTEVSGEIVETFETSSTLTYAPLSEDWVYDEDLSGYAINTSHAASDEYELVNRETDGAWDLPAIYKGRTNPNTVKMVWGDNVVNPTSGKDNGGLIVMANEADPTTDGYFIMVRTNGTDAGKIYLYYMANGGAANSSGSFTKIDEVRYNLSSYPDANDTLAVVLDWSNSDSYNKFDIYVNGTPAANRPLYDDFDHNDDGTKEAIYQPSKHYAGILLSRYFTTTGRNNAVDAFITSGQYTGAGTIVALNATTTFADTAGTLVRDNTGAVDSLRIQVRDENGAPAANVPVFFSVTKGDGEVSAPQPGDEHIRLEAEWGIVNGTMQMITDASASGEKYVVSPSKGDKLGNVTLKFSVDNSGTYYFWARTKATYWTNYVARFELETKTASGGFTWNVLRQQTGSTSWAWSRVYQGDNYGTPFTATLNANQVYTMRVYSVHDNVPFDKFIITTDPSYLPSGEEAVETLFTDADGLASSAWTLGTISDDGSTTKTNEGLNTVVAKALGTTEVVTFTANALPDVPVRMTRTNDEQSGYARDTLSVPLIANLFDQYDNRADNSIADHNLTVRFEVIRGAGDAMLYTGGGTAETVKDTITNDLGQAHMTLILGIQDSIYTIKASLPDFPDVDPVVFTAYVTGGLIEEYTNLSTNQKLLVSEDPDDPDEYSVLSVQVKAEDGKKVVGANIRFNILDGPEGTYLDKINKTTYVSSKTDANGIAKASIFPGIEAGIINVTVNIIGTVDTVLTDSIYYRAARLEYYANNNQKGAINGTLPHALKAIVYDNATPGKGRVVANHPVTFTIDNSVADDFRLLLNSKKYLSIIDTTDVNGVAEAFVQLGATHGYYQDLVKVTSDNGFDPIPAFVQGTEVDTLTFSMYATSTASLLKKVSGDSASGITTEILEKALTVQMLDQDGEPVALQPVIFTIVQGGGHFEGKSKTVTTLTVTTTGDGYASVNYYLGEEPGEYNNIVQVSATNGYSPLWYQYYAGSQGRTPIRFVLSAKTTGAESIGAFTDAQVTGIAGKPLGVPVRVKAYNTGGYGVEGVNLKFSITSKNGGSLRLAEGETSVDTTLEVMTESTEGIATVYWTLGTKAGINKDILQVSPVDEFPVLAGSPVHFYATVKPDSVSAFTSTIEADSTTKATSEDSCMITITLKDAYNNPVSGRHVQLAVKNGTNNFLFQPPDTTDTNGQTTGKLKSLSSGLKVITATDITESGHYIKLSEEKTVIFESNAAKEMTVYSGNSQTGNINTVLPEKVAVRITDVYGNPVNYGPVQYEITSGNGKLWNSGTSSFTTSMAVHSDSNGVAAAYWALGASSGQNTLKVTSDALEGSPQYFSATGQVGQAVRMYMTSDASSTGDAGELLPESFVVRVLDNLGHAIAGVTVNFAIVDGSGSLTASTVTTDAWGNASTYLRLAGQAGITTRVEASGSGLAGSPQLFNATSIAGDAQKIAYASNSGNAQSGYVGETSQALRVLVTDAYGNSVSGVDVTFKIKSGSATISGQQSVTKQTDSDGIAQITATYGNVTGTVIIEASSPYLEGSPVEFTLSILPSQATGIEVFPAEKDYQKVTVGQYLVVPLMVRVVDEFGNSVPGAGVYFEKSYGNAVLWNKVNGNIQGSQAIQSDENGIAGIQLKAGASPSTIKVNALWGQDEVIEFTVESVINPNSPSLNRTIWQTSYAVHENADLYIPLSATADADGDAISFEIANLFPPDGVSIPNPNDNPAVLRWTPTYDQAGQYELALRVVDGQGGYDQDTVTVNVVNVNRPPTIVDFEPETDETVGCGAEIRYWVEAKDPDSDALTYSWELNGNPVGSNSNVLKTNAPDGNGRYTVDVYVSDGTVHDSNRWILTVSCSSVEMAEFFASFDTDSPGISLEWETIKETNNLGFDVFRGYSADDDYTKITDELIATEPAGAYAFKDNDVIAGRTYYYTIRDLDRYGNRTEFGPVSVEIPIPKELSLAQNYPNPFNPSTRIRYQVPKHDHIKLTVYNMMGQKVASLVDTQQEPGYYTVEWNGRNDQGNAVSTGLYIYRIQSSEKVQTKRMIKLK